MHGLSLFRYVSPMFWLCPLRFALCHPLPLPLPASPVALVPSLPLRYLTSAVVDLGYHGCSLSVLSVFPSLPRCSVLRFGSTVRVPFLCTRVGGCSARTHRHLIALLVLRAPRKQTPAVHRVLLQGRPAQHDNLWLLQLTKYKLVS